LTVSSPESVKASESRFRLERRFQIESRFIMNPKNIEDIYELSPMQQGLLFHTLLAPHTAEYFEQISCTLGGDALDVPAWKRAWQEVVNRHPVLRTAFYWEELEKPVQVVQRRAELPVTEEDWRGLSDAEQHERLDAFLETDRTKGFDLAQPPLMRVALLRTGEQAYYFVWSHHHLLLDGWSVQLLFKEVAAGYDAFKRGKSPSLPRTRPYRDYIAWLQRQDLSRAESFWRDYLQGFDAPTPLGVRPVNGNADESGYEEQRSNLSTHDTARLQSTHAQYARPRRMGAPALSL
jgi:hypothetical protein